ncbi:BREX-2 system phosphatase PglZ [Corynebacterium glyciniphilum]|uniref:BREX-2 system phosphatase PglZ n=1 Tax=Corynebacterium glyciniphilum TaxID=1404244 RepID=UPI00265058ED|nr:BREX-2 system phosphatase PglZ [Corynebacterium glyciniphilum]MDN6706343.1 BREX-2 system phosphatase PglZ [Corynebacterium glyciniphilum]
MSAARLPVRRRDIDEQISYLLSKNRHDAVVLMQSPTPWDGPERYRRPDGSTVDVHRAATPLALRWVLTRLDRDVPWHFVVTPLGDDDLVSDMRDRLTPYTAVQLVNPTRSLLGAFSATSVVPGTIAQGDIPDTLAFLDEFTTSVAPAPAGVVTPDHLASQVLAIGLGWTFGPRNLSLTDLMEWSVSPHATERWDRLVTGLPAGVRAAALDWLGRSLSSQAGAALRYLQANGPRGLLSWGLAAEVLTVDPAATPGEAAARQEATTAFRIRTTTGTTTADERGHWASAAVAAVHRVSRDGRSPDTLIREAEQLVTGDDQLNAESLLHLSSVCPGGFAVRIERVATALAAMVTGGPTAAAATVRPVYAALRSARDHRDGDAGRGGDRDIASADAAVRLWQWLHTLDTSPATPGGLSGWLREQRGSLSWVNMCINAAWREQSSTALHRVTRAVAEQARTAVRDRDRAFAAVASHSGASRDLAGPALLIEDVLDKVVKPLLVTGGSVQPVLLLVLDGMSTAAANQLLHSVDTTFHGRWHELAAEDEDLATALAVYPTVTTKSRTSLLSGQLATGGQDVEKRGLSDWFRSAVKGMRGAGEVVLFHKADLEMQATSVTGRDGIAPLVEDTGAHPLVAAVLNTIDDALDKSDPIDRQWSVDDITHLRVLLQAAGRAGRTVVMVSDHGHVVDRGQSALSPLGGNSARWRYAGTGTGAAEEAADREVVVQGDRVLTDDHRAVLAVDEDLRYTARKAGYHGGLSLAEASVPVIVLSQQPEQLQYRMRDTMPLVEMDETMRHPGWWELREDFFEISGGTDADAPETSPAPTDQDGLFALDVAPVTSGPVLFTGLETNPGFVSQVAETPITGQDAASIADILRTIGANNDTLPHVQLQQMLGLSNIQFRGTLTRLKRILNIDGVEVIANRGGDITLNSEQLIQQFGLRVRTGTTTGR